MASLFLVKLKIVKLSATQYICGKKQEQELFLVIKVSVFVNIKYAEQSMLCKWFILIAVIR